MEHPPEPEPATPPQGEQQPAVHPPSEPETPVVPTPGEHQTERNQVPPTDRTIRRAAQLLKDLAATKLRAETEPRGRAENRRA